MLPCCQIGNDLSSLPLPTWKKTDQAGSIIVSGMVTKIRKGARLHYYIKEHMARLGISGDAMAGRIGVSSRSTVWKLCEEQQRLTPGKVMQIADALGMHPSELLFPPGVPSLDAIAAEASPELRDRAAKELRKLLGKAS